jgi:hypothetical protein
MKSIISSVVIVALALCLFAGSAFAQGGLTQTTDHYKTELDIGPLATMLMPNQVAGAKSGEAMVQMPGMAMPEMAMTDQGHPVNHHLEFHIYDKASGAVIKDVVPTITITDQASGASRQLAVVVAMYDVAVGDSDFHWGNNVYLADGMYTITAKVGSDTVTFKDVSVSGGTAPTAMQSMTSTTGSPTTMPMTGGTPAGSLAWLLALGGLASIILGLALILRYAPKRLGP